MVNYLVAQSAAIPLFLLALTVNGKLHVFLTDRVRELTIWHRRAPDHFRNWGNPDALMTRIAFAVAWMVGVGGVTAIACLAAIPFAPAGAPTNWAWTTLLIFSLVVTTTLAALAVLGLLWSFWEAYDTGYQDVLDALDSDGKGHADARGTDDDPNA